MTRIGEEQELANLFRIRKSVRHLCASSSRGSNARLGIRNGVKAGRSGQRGAMLIDSVQIGGRHISYRSTSAQTGGEIGRPIQIAGGDVKSGSP